MTTHRTLSGDWAECPEPGSCELKFHFPDISVEEARRMPLQVLIPLLEAFDPPTDISENGDAKLWIVPLPNNPEMHGYHRDYDLPAVVWEDGAMEWRLNGQLNRLYGRPTAIGPGGEMWWHRDGLLHRDDGKPAIVYADGSVEYWLNGVQVNADGTPIREISVVLSANRSGAPV
jgi:hypothetical protein